MKYQTLIKQNGVNLRMWMPEALWPACMYAHGYPKITDMQMHAYMNTHTCMHECTHKHAYTDEIMAAHTQTKKSRSTKVSCCTTSL